MSVGSTAASNISTGIRRSHRHRLFLSVAARVLSAARTAAVRYRLVVGRAGVAQPVTYRAATVTVRSAGIYFFIYAGGFPVPEIGGRRNLLV